MDPLCQRDEPGVAVGTSNPSSQDQHRGRKNFCEFEDNLGCHVSSSQPGRDRKMTLSQNKQTSKQKINRKEQGLERCVCKGSVWPAPPFLTLSPTNSSILPFKGCKLAQGNFHCCLSIQQNSFFKATWAFWRNAEKGPVKDRTMCRPGAVEREAEHRPQLSRKWKFHWNLLLPRLRCAMLNSHAHFPSHHIYHWVLFSRATKVALWLLSRCSLSACHLMFR